MPNRSPRMGIVITALVLGLVAVSVGIFALTRPATSPPIEPPSPTGDHVPSASPSPTYEPTDPSGSPEPGLQRGQAVAGGGGSKTGPAGLPLGYARDETGAVSAATNYLTWMNSLRIVDKEVADQLAAATAADATTRAALVESFDALRSGMQDMTTDQPEPARGAYAIAAYSASRAVVYVWSPEVTTTADGQTEHLWAVDAVALVWAAGDWKLDGGLIAKSGAAAVDPLHPAGNPSSEEKHSILRRTPADPGEITDAPEQSWFEYANAPR